MMKSIALALLHVAVAVAQSLRGGNAGPQLPAWWDPPLAAYWDVGSCGPMGSNYHSSWCGGVNVTADCPTTIATSSCASGQARRVIVLGSGGNNFNPQFPQVVINGCPYAYFAQYECQASTPAPAPAPSPTAKLVGSGCCRSSKVILGAWHNMSRTECMQECTDNFACHAFAVSGCNSSSDQTCGGACHIYDLESPDEVSAQECSETNGFEGITASTFCFSLQ